MTYNKKLNYCTFSPDRLFGVKFNHACYLHDRQYRNEVKIRKNRKQSDLDLRDQIQKTFTKKNKSLIGFLVSRIYYSFVRIFSGRYWE